MGTFDALLRNQSGNRWLLPSTLWKEFGMSKTQREQLIAEATEKAIGERDSYVQEQVESLVDVLKNAESKVKTANLGEKNFSLYHNNNGESKVAPPSITFGNLLNALKPGREKAVYSHKQLNELIKRALREESVGVTPPKSIDLLQYLTYDEPDNEKNIGRQITKKLQENHSQIMEGAVNTIYKQGIYDGIEILAKGKISGYADLSDEEKSKLVNDIFGKTDVETLVSLASSNDGLAKIDIKLAEEIIKNIQSETDLDKPFKAAQSHTKSNARTELVRAHTLGQKEFYRTAGIKHFIWQSLGDTCEVCNPLAEKKFPLNKEGPPEHYNCDCYIVPVITPEIKERKGKVTYNGKIISDENIRTVLQRIADKLEADVNITSGDRNYVPKGGSPRSDHLRKRAADFLVSGKSLQNVFEKLINKKTDIFDKDKSYQVIHHGKYTATGGSHIHIGHRDKALGVEFKVEGLTPKTKGRYRRIE